MEIQVHNENGRVPVTVLHLSGKLDSSTYQAFESQADELIKNGARYILLDLSDCGYIGSAGFRALNHIHKNLRSAHLNDNPSDEETSEEINARTGKSPYLKLLNLSHEIRTAFELSGFHAYLDTYTNMKTAIDSF